MTRPVLNQINLVVGDLKAASAFYRHLGIDLPDDAAVHAEAHFGDFSLDFDDEESARWWHAGWRADRRPRAVLTFRVEARGDVDATYAEITAAGYRGVQPPFDAFFGSRYAIVVDPDGNEVALMSPRDDTMQSWPPAVESPNP